MEQLNLIQNLIASQSVLSEDGTANGPETTGRTSQFVENFTELLRGFLPDEGHALPASQQVLAARESLFIFL